MTSAPTTMRTKKRTFVPRRTPLVLLLVFLLLLLAGIAVNEPARVLEQARSVCLPCIGIG
ncbi:hypothetical protein [Desulfobulbus elongatus]|uniref:hypothetical protein n=1 Tax=Desulfobulbus elongatus TaxID=53332 RepID=UPI0005584873|nr:hypothetical protein [Desulfobulbus elongatus]